MRTLLRYLSTALATIFTVLPCLAAEPPAAAQQFERELRPLLTKHCVECHSGDKPKGELRLDNIDASLKSAAAQDLWMLIRERVESGEMPPKDQAKLAAAEQAALVGWIDAHVAPAVNARRAEGRAVMRRLNRTEYEHTIRDLLGIEVDLKDNLPLDTSADGFDNSGAALHTSSFLMERYLEAADKSLALAIANKPQPPLVKKRYQLKDERQVQISTEKVYRQQDDALVMFSSSNWNSIVVYSFYPPERGRYRFRISAHAVQSEKTPVSFRVDAGAMLMGTKSELVGYFAAPAAESKVFEFTRHLEARNTIRIHPYGLATAHVVNKIGADKYEGAGLAIDWVEIEGPLHDAWPPESHRRIFGDLEQVAAPGYNQRERVEVASENPTADAERIIKNFATRAFRRPATEEDLAPLLALVKQKLDEKQSFEQAVRVGLTGVLLSPQFLFLQEPPGKLDDYALASRLSYFFWSSLPDQELLQLAADQKLHEPAVLRQQVERLLKDERAHRFTVNFVGQWLGLRDIDFTEPDHLLYPEYDELLKVSSVQESQLFFEEVLKQNLPLTNFVASDFTFLNARLAKHYNIPGVEGWEHQKVKLPPDSHRGGVLTMASVLKVTANGTTTSPIVRGAWVLDRILGTPPAPPPDGVPAIEPDIRGATTVREILAKHRQVESCASCHVKIDPPGFALESFDVIGGWRENYRSLGRGEPVTINGQRMHYAKGPAVDCADVLPSGEKFANIDELKQLLLRDKDALAGALARKLITYATGRAPGTADKREVAAIVARVRAREYGFRDLLREVVQSPLFLEK